METLLAFVVGALFAVSIHLLMRRSMVRIVIGLILFSNAVNLLIFTAGRVTRGQPPIIETGRQVLTEPFANPLAQALILTSIVISFGLLAFTLALVYRINKELDTVNVDDLGVADPPPKMPDKSDR